MRSCRECISERMREDAKHRGDKRGKETTAFGLNWELMSVQITTTRVKDQIPRGSRAKNPREAGMFSCLVAEILRQVLGPCDEENRRRRTRIDRGSALGEGQKRIKREG